MESNNNKTSPTLSPMQPEEVHDSYTLVTEDKRKLWCKQWKPNNLEKAKCAIYICHGFGEHCMVYDALAEMFAQRFDAFVFANDHFGHGRSEGEPRAYTEDFMTFIEDVNFHVDHALENLNTGSKTLPLYIFGHSMGGAISLLYAMKYSKKVAGLMLMSPLIEFSDLTLLQRIKVKATRLIHNLLPAKLPVAKLAASDIVAQEEFIKEFENDPYRYHGWLKMGMASSFLTAITMIEKGRPSFETPVFLGHGTADQLCSLEASVRFMENIPATVKSCKTYENGAHALLHEYNSGIRDRFLKDTTEWLEERLKETQTQ